MENVEYLNENNQKYNVAISNFEGPLDLLCFLISKNKMDIFEISLSELTDKYIEYLNEMQELDMEIATEFMVMATTLLYIKSKKLLPIAEPEDEVECEITEEELIEKIAKYKMYKEKQQELREMYNANFGTFEKLPESIKIKRELDISSITTKENLLAMYNAVLKRKFDKINVKSEEIKKIALYEKVTIKSKVKQIIEVFKKKSSFVFSNIFNKKNATNIDIVTAFLSVLELSRLKHVNIKQDSLYGDIHVNKISKTDIDISLIKE